MRRFLLLALPAFVLAGCSEESKLGAPMDGGDGGGADDTGDSSDGDSGDSATDTGGTPEPAWYTVRATLLVAEGAASLEGAAVEIVVVGDDRATTVCEVPLDLSSLAVGTPPDASVAVWWDLTVTAAQAPCAPLPATLGLGIGELAADVRAQLGRDALEDVAESLFGAYLVVDAGPLSTFGWAATASGMDGESVAVLPPPDGEYALEPVYLLPLP